GRLHEARGHVVDVVDTVGAGDAFVAGYLSAQLDGLGVPGRLARANACGALACTVPGDWEGAPRGRRLEALRAGSIADPVSRCGAATGLRCHAAAVSEPASKRASEPTSQRANEPLKLSGAERAPSPGTPPSR